MPEGDTITKLARRITDRFVGQPLVSATTRHPTLSRRAETVDAGATLIGAAAVGKYLLLRFDDNRTLYSHLGMDGQWSIDRAWPRSRAERQVELAFPDGTLIASALDKVGVVPTNGEDAVLGRLGPDLCADEPPDAATVTERLTAAPPAALAAAMLDQRRVAGWGNVFAVEVPFILGLDPARSTDTIGDLIDLASVGIALIRWSAAGHPRNTTGRNLGRADHFVYASPSGRCPVCGTGIAFTSADDSAWGRAAWRCPTCQADTHGRADSQRARRLLALHPALRTL